MQPSGSADARPARRLWREPVRHWIDVTLGVIALEPKFFLVFRGWVWMNIIAQVIAVTVAAYFWRAVYASSPTLGGLNEQQAINYILLSWSVGTVLAYNSAMWEIGWRVSDGMIGIELLRPLDFQLTRYVAHATNIVLSLIINVIIVVFAVVFLGLHLPADALVWISFLISLFLGHAVMFHFDWIIGCAAFYTTETWGLGILREGFAGFFSGTLIPLSMMPEALRAVANLLPFAQGVYVPLSILAGTQPLSQVPSLLLTQILWLIVLVPLSRLVFAWSVRKITIQGG